MSILNSFFEDAFFFIDRDTARWKIVVTKSDGSTEQINGYVLKGKYSKSLFNYAIGSFNITLNNNSQHFTDYFSGEEKVEIYGDDINATQLRFTGFVDDIKQKYDVSNGYVCEIGGADYSGKYSSRNVTGTFNDDGAVVLKNIISTYGSASTSGIPASIGVNVKRTWKDKPILSTIKYIAAKTRYDILIDETNVVYMIQVGTSDNYEDAIHIYNMRNVDGLLISQKDIINKVRVVGYSTNNELIIYTTPTPSGTIKEKMIVDANLTSYDEVKQRAEAELVIAAGLKGRAKSKILNYTRQGDNIWISIPHQGIHAKYRVVSLNQSIETSGENLSEVEVYRVTENFSDIFASLYDMAQESSAPDNPNDMGYSKLLDFSSSGNIDSSLSNNVNDANGYLTLDFGVSSGNFVSTRQTLDKIVSKLELRIVGDSTSLPSYYYSLGDGLNWIQITPNESVSVSSDTTILRIKAIITSDKVIIKSINVLCG